MQELIKEIEDRLNELRFSRKCTQDFKLKNVFAELEAELEWVLGKLYDLQDSQ